MDIKEVLKTNKITQQDFADYMGYTRQSLSGTFREGKERKSLINNLKLATAEKNGISIDITEEGHTIVSFDLTKLAV